MATRQFNLRALAVIIGCASLLPVACGGDDDSNPTPPGSGGTGAKGGTGGKGGSGANGGTSGSAGASEGGATTGGTDASGGKGGSSGGKGGSSSGGKGGTGSGTGGNAGTPSEAGSSGAPEAGSGGTGGTGSTLHDCTDDDKVTYNCGTTAHPANIECYSNCNPTKTDGSEQFMNRCPNEPWTLGGVTATCQPWTTKLSKLGSDCTALGSGCTLPDLP